MNDISFFAAPLQGYTDAIWRHCHALIYGGVDLYFTPFAQIEKGTIRPKDIKDIFNPLNANHKPVVQIIFKNVDEFAALCDRLTGEGIREIDLNMGCPFVPQLKKGRGAATLLNASLLSEISELMSTRYSSVRFSLKMRPGVSALDEWKSVMPAISAMPLSHLTVHPRTARQQYSGSLSLDTFAGIADSGHRMIFNGEIHTLADIDGLLCRFPDLSGIMAGRGLLARPSLFSEWREGVEWSEHRRCEALYELHARVLDYYKSTLCGEAQILNRIQPFWDYLETVIGHKSFKAIKKAASLARYQEAVDSSFLNRSSSSSRLK